MKNYPLLLIMLVWCSCTTSVTETPQAPSAFVTFADSLFNTTIDSAYLAGASVVVQKDGDILLQKNYGMASLELQASMPEEPIFEIGSVTKQFTAAAILRLVKTNKISLDADVTDYLDFNTKGRSITIHQLLNHTSGIPSYTEIPAFWSLSLHSYPRDTMLTVIDESDFLFEPGERLIYNNSAYFLLGLIIEKQSGMSYEEFLKQEFFEPLGMDHTYYCSNENAVQGKVYGYDYNPEGLKQKDYLDHTWPYAAGSLCSSANDLLKWLNALHGGKFFDQQEYALLTAPQSLNDGTPLRYAMGLAHYKDHGREMIQHGGGINGFLSETRYYPRENLYIICLVNTTGPKNPGGLADALTWNIMSKKDPPSVEMETDMASFSGTYGGQVRGRMIEVDLAIVPDGLVIKQGNNDTDTVTTYIGNNTFMDGNDIYTFQEGFVSVDQVYGYYKLEKK